ncbi:acyl-CoA dehydrogenase domain-containing protein [Natronococcus jeotgali DSM 18795]|uniref:Acyl-CoA dehydrogenase domain-containing protein n=1 Tax=Natronococcus jeotgali DSM 18795 TaxID=1227498 RepID=L9XW15_9EURY|nr:acyl-CoA dehydrogenase domain-containing protein [Natronococcus jeotgali DSM 18795]
MDDGIDYGRYEEGRHCNYWTLDRALRREVRRIYGDAEYEWAEARLEAFGETVGHAIADNADYVDDHGPELDPYDERGDVRNFVRYPAEQFENERLAYEAGIVADAFEAPPGRDEPMPLSHTLAMQYLLCYADPGFDCPVAMTAGAALVLEKFGGEDLEPYYEALTSREYEDLIEGAMFLTEKQGGSDVGANETRAEYGAEADRWRLYGEKWFCSNVDAEGTLALARTADAPDGTAGLSMFLVPHADPETASGPVTKGRLLEDGPLEPDEVNDQLYRRLKDKLGTISVPTAEVEFTGAKAILVGEAESGFRQMTEMLNLERLSNAAASCGIVGRVLLESKIHAANREAFGQPIDRYPLMRADLVDMTVAHEAATAFTFEAARLLSERERAARAGEGADDVSRLLRLLVPIAKLRTARIAVDTASYGMEIRGGDGYVDDYVTNRMLRDAQVLPIWEGTENVLSLRRTAGPRARGRPRTASGGDREPARSGLAPGAGRLRGDRRGGVSRPAGGAVDAYRCGRRVRPAVGQATRPLRVRRLYRRAVARGGPSRTRGRERAAGPRRPAVRRDRTRDARRARDNRRRPVRARGVRPDRPTRGDRSRRALEVGDRRRRVTHSSSSAASSTSITPCSTALSTRTTSSSGPSSPTSASVTFSVSPTNSGKSVPSASAVSFLTR